MRLPDDVFPTPLQYHAYVATYRVRVFMEETSALDREVVLACLLKNIDTANDEIARLKALNPLHLVGLAES